MVVVAVRSGRDYETLNKLKKTGITHGADLEEDGLAVAADGAAHVLGAGQRGVAGDVLEHLGELAGAVVHHVPVHAVVVRNLLQQSISFQIANT